MIEIQVRIGSGTVVHATSEEGKTYTACGKRTGVEYGNMTRTEDAVSCKSCAKR